MSRRRSYKQPTFFGPPTSDDEEMSNSNSFAPPDSDDNESPNRTGDTGLLDWMRDEEKKPDPRRRQSHSQSESETRGPSDDNGKVKSALVNGRPVYLSIIRQPEVQHRARYMSEGSRGAIKGRYGKSHCTVQLSGHNRATRVEVYAGTGGGVLGPHLLYRALPVTGKGGGCLTTPCKEITAKDGLNCVQLTLRPDNKMTAALDGVGILKICGHEMGHRVPKTERNTSIRLVIRAYVPDDTTGQEHVVQILSDPISCVQQLGYPEVQKVSLTSDSLRGGSELFVLGKNFDKNTKVVFREWDAEGNLVWTSEAKVDKKTLHQVPTYKSLTVANSVDVSMTIECGKKTSHPQPFTFLPGTGESRQEPEQSGESWTNCDEAAFYPTPSWEASDDARGALPRSGELNRTTEIASPPVYQGDSRSTSLTPTTNTSPPPLTQHRPSSSTDDYGDILRQIDMEWSLHYTNGSPNPFPSNGGCWSSVMKMLNESGDYAVPSGSNQSSASHPHSPPPAKRHCSQNLDEDDDWLPHQ